MYQYNIHWKELYLVIGPIWDPMAFITSAQYCTRRLSSLWLFDSSVVISTPETHTVLTVADWNSITKCILSDFQCYPTTTAYALTLHSSLPAGGSHHPTYKGVHSQKAILASQCELGCSRLWPPKLLTWQAQEACTAIFSSAKAVISLPHTLSPLGRDDP